MLEQFRWPSFFIAILIGIFFYYHYDDSLFKRPQSVHHWRQADCASLALNYYQDGMDFFHPQVHNLTSDNFTTGYTSTSEMPLLYYSVAILYHIFGYHEFLYRLLNVLIFFTGLFYLYKLFYKLLKHQFWAICLPLLIFSSPVLVYYANNFLSNSAALGFVFIGWYHFIEYFKSKNEKCFKLSLIFFTLAGLLKITALLSLGAVIGVYILENIFRLSKDKVFSGNKWRPMAFVFAIAIIGMWTAYAAAYNKFHISGYFSTTIFPIWEMSWEEITAVKNNVFKIWFGQYFNEFLWGFLFMSTLAIVLLHKGVKQFYLLILTFLLLGAWAFMALQFATLQDHDYYTINLFIIPVFILITLFDLIKTHFPRVLKSKITMIVFFAFTFYNVNYAKTEINNRYYGWWNNDGIKNDIEDITPYLRSIGIERTDTIISIPDESHLSLYLMNQKGWTQYAERFYNRGETVYLNQDHAGMEASINTGAKYLVINGLNELYSKPYLQEYAMHLAGQFREVLIFDLSKRGTRNFIIPNRKVKEILVCNAESVDANYEDFIALHGPHSFGGASTQSDEFAYSGSYSSRLTSEDPYGMTLEVPRVSFGESFIVSVMRKKGTATFDLIAGANGKPKYYLHEYEIHKTENPEWEMLKMEFHIPRKMDGRELRIYLWNHGSEPAYADDLKIVRFHSYYRSDR